jgi:hypothetical protein
MDDDDGQYCELVTERDRGGPQQLSEARGGEELLYR